MPKSDFDLQNPPLANDWESMALRRVAGRVEALGADADANAMRRSQQHSDPGTPDEVDFGWEESVLQRLRRHLFDT